MAILHGKAANVYWDSQVTDTVIQFCQNWTLDVTHDVTDTTSMQDTWKTYFTGFQDWTAAVTGYLPLGGSDLPMEGDATPQSLGQVGVATTARLELYVIWDTVTPLYTSLYGEGWCTGIEYGADANGTATVTYTFQGTGQIQWDTGTERP